MFYYRLDFVKWDLDKREKNMKIICEKFDKKSWLCCDIIKRSPNHLPIFYSSVLNQFNSYG